MTPPTPAAPLAAMPLIELEFGRGNWLRISGSADPGLLAAVILIPSDVRVWIATGHTDMPRGDL